MEAEYQSLKASWLAGDRDRDLSLRLMFFAWMHWADPPFVTRLTDDPEAEALWHAIFDHFGGEKSLDNEFLFAAGTMASIFPYVLGDEGHWATLGARMRKRALVQAPFALSEEMFEGRGKYGQYFAHQLRGATDRSWGESGAE